MNFSFEDHLFADLARSRNKLLGQKVHINVFAKFNLISGYPSLTWPSALCASPKGRHCLNFQAETKVGWRGLSLFIDDFIPLINRDNLKSDYNVALLIESRAIKTSHYSALLKHAHQFDLILTHDLDISKKFPEKSLFIPADTISLADDSWDLNISSKTKYISHVFSDKTSTIGHRLRHKASSLIQNSYVKLVDQYGSGVNNFIENKHDAFVDYRYSLVIENVQYDYYFTEKILDCFLSGVIPIYWGCPSISRFFDSRGILEFNTMNQLNKILSTIAGSPEHIYNQLSNYAKINFQLALNYLYLDDLIVYAIVNRLDKLGKLDKLLPFLLDDQSNLPKLNLKKP